MKAPKIAIIIICLCIIPLLTSCGSVESIDAPEQIVHNAENDIGYEEHSYDQLLNESDVADVKLERGTWSSGFRFYENEHMGIRFSAPLSWGALSDYDIAEAMGLERRHHDTDYVDLSSMAHEMTVENLIGNHVQIMFLYTGTETAIEQIKETFADSFTLTDGTVVEFLEDTRRIGPYYYSGFNMFTEPRFPDYTVAQRHYFSLKNGVLTIIAITLFNDHYSFDDIIGMFSDLSEPLPEEPQKEFPEEFLGKWSDDRITISFFPHGEAEISTEHGEREISWFVEGNNHLVLDFLDSFTFSLDGDQLHIELRDILGVYHNLVRR